MTTIKPWSRFLVWVKLWTNITIRIQSIWQYWLPPRNLPWHCMWPCFQQEDLVSLGKVLLALSCNSIIGIERDRLQTSMEIVARNYSSDLKNLIMLVIAQGILDWGINSSGSVRNRDLDQGEVVDDLIECQGWIQCNRLSEFLMWWPTNHQEIQFSNGESKILVDLSNPRV